MVGSNDDVSIDIGEIYNGGKEHHVKTCHGSVSVVVYGDHEKPALITYPDVALNWSQYIRLHSFALREKELKAGGGQQSPQMSMISSFTGRSSASSFNTFHRWHGVHHHVCLFRIR